MNIILSTSMANSPNDSGSDTPGMKQKKTKRAHEQQLALSTSVRDSRDDEERGQMWGR